MVYCVRKFNGCVTKDHKNIRTRSMKNVSEAAVLREIASIDWKRVIC